MGRNKQAQRTKNNARPSSSSRCAELLGTSMPNYVGFSAVEDGGYVPLLPGLSFCNTNEVEMNNVDSNFQIVLKKMNKKDTTTKCKALQEFAFMCKNSELSAVEGMLPFWPRLYCTLAIDVEHRVRESTQVAHAAVVKRVGKGIAMYLKQIAGTWFTSQHDMYPPAASAASSSFNDTFPQKKLVDAIVHCQREILTYICDNITVHTPQSLSIQKNVTPEEMEVKYQRMLIASLLGYSVYLKSVPIDKMEKMVDIHIKIISSNKFWKLVKYDALPVKIAFFNVLTSIIENASVLLENEKKKTVTTIMNSLDETEPALLSAIWESMLVTITKIEDWYSVVNVEKLVLPKLWRVLRSGGQSCPTIVHPNLLPFISQFPKLKVDPKYLYTNFFNNMREGFSVKCVQTSRSEMFAVAKSFAECLRYSVLLNINNQDLCSVLLKEQLIPVIEMCLKETGPLKQILFNEITDLVRYWSKNRHNEGFEYYSQLVQQFWQELDVLYDSLVDFIQNSETFNTIDTNNSQIEFLFALKTVPACDKKNLKVQFSNPEENIITLSQVQITESDIDAEFLTELNKFVNSLCVKYFNKITENDARRYVVYLYKLLIYFESEEISKNLSEFLKTQMHFPNFYNSILRNLLSEKSEETEHIIELTIIELFVLMKYMSEPEKNEILESLKEFNEIVITKSIVQCALSKKHRNDDIIRKWCSQSNITSLLIDVAKEIASGNYSDFEKNRNLILLALEPLDDGNLLIKEEGIIEIISILCNSFHEIDETRLLDFAKLISRIVPLTWTHKQSMVGAVQILETLFELRSQNYFSNNSALMDTMQDVWKKGLLEAIRKISRTEFIDMTKKIAMSMWKKIYDSNEEYNKEILVDIAVDFLEIIINEKANIKEDYTEEIILAFLIDSNITTWTTEATGIIIYGEVISGKLYVSSLDQNVQIHQKCMSIDMTNTAVTDNVENCLKWTLFNINLLNNLCLRSTNKIELKASRDEKILVHNLNLPGITNLIVNFIYSIILGQIYSDYYKSTKCYSNVNIILLAVEDSFEELRIYVNEDTFKTILEHIKINYAKYGSMLTYIIRFCCTGLCFNSDSKKLFENYKSSNIFGRNEEIMLQSLQILSKFQDVDDISTSMNNDIYALVAARTVLIDQEDSSKYLGILEKMISEETQNPSVLATDCDIFEMSWEKLNLPLEFIRFLTELVKKVPTKLTHEHWNFIFMSLILWQLSISKSEKNASDFKVSTLTVAVCQLHHALQNLIDKYEQKQITDKLPILDEWKNVFVGARQSGMVQCWMLHADSYNEKTTALKPVILLEHLGRTVKMLDQNIIFTDQAGPSLVACVNLSLKLLQSPVASIQLGAYHVLKHVIPQLVQEDKDTVELKNFDLNTLNIKKIEDVLQNTQNIVNTILIDFKLCGTVSCTIEPYTDSYTYTVGYLLSWVIILEMCANADGDLLYQYAELLKDNFFPNLLNNIFRLMPVELLQDNKKNDTNLLEIFSTEPSLDFGESWTEWKLDHIVCWLYTNCLRHLPVLVRQWWSTVDSRVSAAVDKITTHYVSGMLCREELLNSKLENIENMQVKIFPVFREVVALYQMDDTELELSIVLARNHPLGPVTVVPGKHAGGTANWRNCHMQLSIFLTYQNGSVWDGLVLWKRNLDKKFAGVERCYICYSIFHINTYQIPKLSCHTCRKKFHTACLYKWFSASQKSACPICRNMF